MIEEHPRVWALPVPYEKPPLSLNYRMHWRQAARIRRELRRDMALIARGKRIPPLQRAQVQLHYAPATRRFRDVDSLVATSKPCLDAMIDAGVLRDDTPEFVDHLMPALDPPTRPARLTFFVTDLTPPGDQS